MISVSGIFFSIEYNENKYLVIQKYENEYEIIKNRDAENIFAKFNVRTYNIEKIKQHAKASILRLEPFKL
jgi:uncharacterized protein YjbK